MGWWEGKGGQERGCEDDHERSRGYGLCQNGMELRTESRHGKNEDNGVTKVKA